MQQKPIHVLGTDFLEFLYTNLWKDRVSASKTFASNRFYFFIIFIINIKHAISFFYLQGIGKWLLHSAHGTNIDGTGVSNWTRLQRHQLNPHPSHELHWFMLGHSAVRQRVYAGSWPIPLLPITYKTDKTGFPELSQVNRTPTSIPFFRAQFSTPWQFYSVQECCISSLASSENSTPKSSQLPSAVFLLTFCTNQLLSSCLSLRRSSND